MRGFPSNHRFLNTVIRAVTNDKDGRVRLHWDGGRSEIYDHVILATHGDEAYSIIQGSATAEEKQIMSKFRTSANTAILHADVSLMPWSRKVWSSWNCLTRSSSSRSSKGNIGHVSITYNLNILQRIPEDVFGNVLVTLNPLHHPEPKSVQGRYNYRHPLYDASTIRAQQNLARIQNTRGISYAGAWTKYGLHEDGFSSGLYVAQEHLGAKLPFRFKEDSILSQDEKPELGVADLILRLLILMVQVFFIEPIDMALDSYRGRQSRRGSQVNGSSGTMKVKKLL